MFTPREIFAAFLLSALITTAILLAGWWPARKRVALPEWVGPLAVGAGALWGFLAIFGFNFDPHGNSVVWVLYGVIAALLLGLFDSLMRMPRVVRAIPPLLVAAALPWMVMHRSGIVAHITWPDVKFAGGMGLLLTLSWLGLDYAGEKRPGAWTAFLLTATIFASVIFLFDAYGMGARFGLVLLILAALVTAVSPLVHKVSMSRGLALVFMLSLYAILVYTYLDNEASLRSLILLIATPGLIAVAEIPPLRNTGWWGRGIIKLAIVLTVLGFAAAPSVRNLQKMIHEDSTGESSE